MHFYDKLRVKTLINAHGNMTRLGGSLMNPTVLKAMNEAAEHYIDLNDLHAKAGAYIAKLLGVEAAYITSGAAAGLTIGLAACIAGSDPAKIRRLPDLSGMKNEVLMQKGHRNGYDQAVRGVGITLTEFGVIKETHPWELQAALTERTAAVVHFVEFDDHRNLPLSQVVSIAHDAGVPVIVDAAAEIPPVENLRRFIDLGADLVVYSGGKDLHGPQPTGLVLGRRDLIRACALNASPNYSIGRPMKVGKEEIAGLVTAIELYLQQDFEAEAREWDAVAHKMADALSDVPGLTARRVSPGEPGIQPNWIPRVHLDWDQEVIRMTRDDIMSRLLEGEPGVAVGVTSTGIFLNPHTLLPGEEEIVVRRVRHVLSS
jgi:uncharacterized pyridoxal phosphate-dependent enzyme